MLFPARIGLPYTRLKPASTPRLFNPFPSSRILTRHCSRSFHEAPRPRYNNHKPYGQHNYYQSPTWFELNNGKIICGGIVLACTGVTAYNYLLIQQSLTSYSNKVLAELAEFRKHFVMSYQGIKEGRYYTILTSALNHNGVLHYGFNMFALMSFGQGTIMLFGPTLFMCLLTGSVLAGGVAQYYWWDRERDYSGAAVGLSGGIFGLVTAETILMPRASVVFFFLPMPAWAFLSVSVAASVAGLQGKWGENIGHADHLGGMAFGAVFCALVLRGRFRV